MIHDILVAIPSLALGFVGGFVVMKYKAKTAGKIQATVNDVTAAVETQVNNAVDSIKK